MPDMEQRPSNAAVKDVRIKLRKEECVKVMVQSGQYVVVKVVQVRLSKEECASGMEQRSGSNDAAVKDVQTEECAFKHGTKVEYSSEKGGVCRRHEGFKVCDAEVMDLQINLSKEEPNYAEV